MVRFLESCRAFYKGAYYPLLVLLLVFVGHTTRLELIFGGILMLTVAFGLLISHDVKFTMMPLLAAFFIIPSRGYTPVRPRLCGVLSPARGSDLHPDSRRCGCRFDPLLFDPQL